MHCTRISGITAAAAAKKQLSCQSKWGSQTWSGFLYMEKFHPGRGRPAWFLDEEANPCLLIRRPRLPPSLPSCVGRAQVDGASRRSVPLFPRRPVNSRPNNDHCRIASIRIRPSILTERGCLAIRETPQPWPVGVLFHSFFLFWSKPLIYHVVAEMSSVVQTLMVE